MTLDKEYYQGIMESLNSENYPWQGWTRGGFPFEVEGVRSGVMDVDGSAPEDRAEDLKRVLPNLKAVNDFMKKLFPGDPKARAEKIEVEGVSCNDCGGDLLKITVPHISGTMYLGFIYSLDCGSGAQMPSF